MCIRDRAGWGPMISETAFFVKDVIGPNGSVSIVSDDDTFKKDSDNLENHTKNNCLKIHSSKLDSEHNFISPNKKDIYDDDPSHQDLCDYEQEYFYKSISDNIDLKTKDTKIFMYELNKKINSEKKIRNCEKISYSDLPMLETKTKF